MKLFFYYLRTLCSLTPITFLFLLLYLQKGVWIHFESLLQWSYGTVLKFFYEQALSWAYEPNHPLPRQDIELALADHKALDVESFLGYFYLWQYVSTRLPLPIPQLERIIPFAVSQWNSIKGGSDTITKLLWSNMYDPPCNTPQSHAIGRMLLVGSVIIHRLNHFFTAKPDLEKGYPSLKHFRWAAQKRSSFHDTLLQIVQAIKQRSVLPTAAVSTSSSNVEGILTRRTDTRTKAVAWGSVSTGFTPQKCINKWYGKNPQSSAEAVVHSRMRECRGVPVYRVNPETKNIKGAGSRGHCAECNKITNLFCIICKRWLCDPHLAANRGMNGGGDDPKFIKITLDDGKQSGKEATICAVYSCWHKAHQEALAVDGAEERGWHICDNDVHDISSLSSN
jgi:hypothetical protein